MGSIDIGSEWSNFFGDPWVLQSEIPTVSKILSISIFWVNTNIFDSLTGFMISPKKDNGLSFSLSSQVKSYSFSSSYLISFLISLL